jgi:hypothetical protein
MKGKFESFGTVRGDSSNGHEFGIDGPMTLCINTMVLL